jgi:phospholipid/cholesterol/gamma-HCH transport system permease protein
MKILTHIGNYFIMLKLTFGKFTKWKILKQLILKDIDTLIIGSLGIVSFISFFVGGVGKVGSYITSSIGTMRVTEQIDALEVMGINTHNYLIFPKIVSLSLYPLVICISMFLGIFGGYIAAVYGGFSSSADYIEGIQMDFIPFHITYAFIKTSFFSFILATIPAYHGYYMNGGALEVGKASTVSFVWTSVVIILLNYLITQLLLT